MLAASSGSDFLGFPDWASANFFSLFREEEAVEHLSCKLINKEAQIFIQLGIVNSCKGLFP